MLFPTNHMAALGKHSPLPNINAQQSWQEKKIITTCFYFVVKTHTGGKDELKALAPKTKAQHDTPTRLRGNKIVGLPIF